MDKNNDEDGSGLGYIQFKVGDKEVKLSGVSGLFAVMAICVGINLGYKAITGEYLNALPEQNVEASEPQSP